MKPWKIPALQLHCLYY